jgi:hypothetical protein
MPFPPTAACRCWGGLGITDDMIVARLPATSAISALMTAPPSCTAGRSPAACYGRVEASAVTWPRTRPTDSNCRALIDAPLTEMWFTNQKRVLGGGVRRNLKTA